VNLLDCSAVTKEVFIIDARDLIQSFNLASNDKLALLLPPFDSVIEHGYTPVGDNLRWSSVDGHVVKVLEEVGYPVTIKAKGCTVEDLNLVMDVNESLFRSYFRIDFHIDSLNQFILGYPFVFWIFNLDHVEDVGAEEETLNPFNEFLYLFQLGWSGMVQGNIGVDQSKVSGPYVFLTHFTHRGNG